MATKNQIQLKKNKQKQKIRPNNNIWRFKADAIGIIDGSFQEESDDNDDY